MDSVLVQVLFDLFMGDVVGDQLDVGWNLFRSIFLALNDGELRPLGVLLPEPEDGFCSFQCATTSQMEKRLVVGLDRFIEKVS